MKQTSRPAGRLGASTAALLAVLAGCGGGGGDAPAPDPVVTYNVQAAFKNLPSSARSYTLAGSASNGSALTLVWAITPKGASVFPLTNASSRRVDSSVVVSTATQTLVDGGQESHFNDAMDGLGSVLRDGRCSQGSNPALPTAAVPGATGDLGDATVYGTCALTAPVVNRITGNWTLEQGTGMVYMCANTTLTDAAGATVSRESDCVEIAPNGTVGSHARLKLTVLGTELTFSN
jgi:hypothetical protein